jgi:alpha,alpha-trehalose-phosphate synthase [UDP-forming]/trehalose-phosphatase
MQAKWQQLASAGHLVIALDLDGTLIPFAPTPEEARLDSDSASLIAALAGAPGVTLGIVSGRPLPLVQDLPPRFPAIAFAAEHGVWRCAGGVWECALPAMPQLDEIERAVRQLAARNPGALVERKSCSVCLHWRRVDPARHDAIAAAAETVVDEWLETHQQFERLPAALALEVRHRAAHKGGALGWLRGLGPQGAPVLALGDDLTDEDMFVGLREGDLGILVSPQSRRTQASLRLPDPDAVHRFLRWVIDARSEAWRAEAALAAPDVLVITRPPHRPSEPRLIVASNRLPATPNGRQREVGGLVSALLPVLAETDGIWLGWSGAEREPGLRLRTESADAITRAQFDYPPTWRQRFYAGFCNQSLWPLLHGFRSRARFVDDEWQCYNEANRAYADKVLEVGGAGATVWIQDFHLMLVGRELRRAGHHGRIGFYLHVPFPSLDEFETMPWASEVVSALLDFDLIGLQSLRWRDNFIATARALLGSEAEVRARDRSRVIGVGIDPERFAEAAAQTADNSDLGAFDPMLRGRKLILGVDRLDYSKGIPERLEAFARLLERFPEWRGKVSFVQVSVPTRSEVPEYAELRARVELLVGRINGAFGEADWTPVRYLYRSYDQATLARLYRLAPVAMVTPLRDGMNLVAKEYVAAQDPADPGVLVLSRFCGAAEQMALALLTNPFHVDGVAADLDTALRMPRDERITRHAALRASVWQDTASVWAKSFLTALAD